MARYVEVSHIVKKLLSVSITDDLYGMGIKTGIDQALKFIEETPTADVAEVKHSRWENISGFDVCNICGTSPAYCEPKPNNPKGYPPYCHYCGAKMDISKTEITTSGGKTE